MDAKNPPEIAVRIIRPTQDGLAASPLGGRLGRPASLDVNLGEVRKQAERDLRAVVDEVARLNEEARQLEASIAARQAASSAALDDEERRRRAALEVALLREGEAARIEAEAARKAAAETGHAEGRAEGLAAGTAEGLAAGRDEGYRKGFEEGNREGREAGWREAHDAEKARLQAEIAPIRPVLEGLLQEIGSRRSALLRSAREELLPLAMEIARKVVKREIRECPEIVLRNLRKAIDLAFRRTALVLEVHPEDIALVERHVPDLAAKFRVAEGITVRGADDVGRGGCRVASSSGVVDLRIEAQLELIEQALFTRLEEGDPEEESDRPAAAAPGREVKGERAEEVAP